MVFKNGKVTKSYSFDEVRKKITAECQAEHGTSLGLVIVQYVYTYMHCVCACMYVITCSLYRCDWLISLLLLLGPYTLHAVRK